VTAIIDSDQHLYEARTMWVDHIDPGMRAETLRVEDDDLGYAWLTWRGRRLAMADVTIPGETARIGRQRRRHRAGEPSEYAYDEALPADFWEPSARVARLDGFGVDSAVLFPNFGLLWERRLSESLPALTANMTAWNRWAATVAAASPAARRPVRQRLSRLQKLTGIGATLSEMGLGGRARLLLTPRQARSTLPASPPARSPRTHESHRPPGAIAAPVHQL